ncbi:hypothetical protein VTK73DRAFT_1316 [Phialemonium thermophilum]|uniref:Peptidase A1 domain-containing protein n=1 Tax=Phialemonium thermophilum TaxID=223376 RepID=A0ABR3VTM8_9PEZI
MLVAALSRLLSATILRHALSVLLADGAAAAAAAAAVAAAGPTLDDVEGRLTFPAVEGRDVQGLANPSGFLRMPVSRHSANTSHLTANLTERSITELAKRWGREHVNALASGVVYVMDLSIGTPPQTVQVVIDTGAYQVWVNQSVTSYYPSASQTASYIGPNMTLQYGTGALYGQMWSDTVQIAMFQVPTVRFLVALFTTIIYPGILGLAYTPPTSPFTGLISAMVQMKYINAPIFSLGLGSLDNDYGEVIFGGVNRARFADQLEPLDIWPPTSQQTNGPLYLVNMTSLGWTEPGGPSHTVTPSNFSLNVLIDTGSSLSYLPWDAFQLLIDSVNAVHGVDNYYVVNCKYQGMNGTFDFGFNHGKMVIRVPYKEFIYSFAPDICFLGVQPTTSTAVLGSTFLRAAYGAYDLSAPLRRPENLFSPRAGLLTPLRRRYIVAFDQESDVVWMGQFKNCGDEVVSVGRAGLDTGNVVGAC